MSTNAATTNATPSRRSSSGTSDSTRPTCAERTSSARIVAPARSAIDSSRCNITIGQRRPLAIASKPIGAWASVPRNTASASRGAQRDSAGARRTASQVSKVTAIVIAPTRRLPNSTNACAFLAGSGCPASQPGQSRQPSPESVSRTAAPVPTINHSAPSWASASGSSWAGVRTSARKRASAVGWAFTAASLERVEERRIPVRTIERSRARAEEQRAVGGVQQHGHHVRTAQVPEDPFGAGRLAELRDSIGAHPRTRDDERHRIARVDDVGIGGRGMIAGEADDHTVGRQIAERTVECLDHGLLPPRVLRVAGGVGALHVAEHEGVAGGEPLARKLDSPEQVGGCVIRLRFLSRLEADGAGQTAEERGARDERPTQAVPLFEARHVVRPPP